MKWYLAPIIFLISLVYSTEVLGQIEIDTVGETQYAPQSFGPTGNRIALDNLGGVHFAWTKSYPYPSTRSVYYNCIANGISPFPGVGQAVSYRNGAGYTQIGVLSDNRDIIAYHHPTIDAESVLVAIDAFNCLGLFEYHRAPNRLSGNAFIWPSLAVDRSDRIHVLSTQTTDPGAPQRFVYTRSANDGGSWTAAQVIDTITFSSVVTASRVSDKVAIVYARPNGSSQKANNIIYIQSQDGVTWDFNTGRVNITSYPTVDSIYAYYDFDAIYDSDDNLHIIWLAQAHVSDTVTGPVLLYHYDTNSGSISEITRYEMPALCQFPVGYNALAMISLAGDSNGRLFTAYSRFDTSDCSIELDFNGELYMQYSPDGGSTWNSPINISNTPTPFCQPAHCASELWPSLAEIADENIHLICIGDNANNGDEMRDNSVEYYKIPVIEMRVNSNSGTIPDKLALGAYPNPFNAHTTLSFSLDHSGPVTLEVFDLLGRKAATLLDDNMLAGEHQIVWNAGQVSSGIYYCRLNSGSAIISNRLILVK